MKETINAVIKLPGKNPQLRTIPNTLEALQGLVGGYIETLPVASDLVAVVNEEGRLQDLAYNMDIAGQSVVGTIVFVGVDGGEFTDVPELLRKQINSLGRWPRW